METASLAGQDLPRACPFCGSKEVALHQVRRHTWHVCCRKSDCAATGPVCDSQETALFHWNVRIVTAVGEPI